MAETSTATSAPEPPPRPVRGGPGDPRPGPFLRTAGRLVAAVARRRRAPALHPVGVRAAAVLRVRPRGRPWGVPWLDTAGEYEVDLRWSRAVGLPGRLPDGFGLALRVRDAGGPGRPLDLLLTSSGRGRWTRHLPLPRRDPLAGPFTTLVPYRAGEGTALLGLWPRPSRARPVAGDLAGLRHALDTGPVRLLLCAVAPGERWRPLGELSTRAPEPGTAPEATLSYDPYLRFLPRLRPTRRLARLRETAYRASRAGRGAARIDAPAPGSRRGADRTEATGGAAMARVSPIDVQKALKGASYPAGAEELVSLAEDNGADEAVLERLRDAGSQRFDGPDDVQRDVFGGGS